MKKMIGMFQRFIGYLILCIFMAACQQTQNGTCISPASPPPSLPESKSFTLNSNGITPNGNYSWINTGIIVGKGDSVIVGAIGTISLCPGRVGMDGSNNNQGEKFFINAANVPWSPTINAGAGDYVQIIVAGPYDDSSIISRFSTVSHNCTNDSNGNPKCDDAHFSSNVDATDRVTGGVESDGQTYTPYIISCTQYEQTVGVNGGQPYCSNSAGLGWRYNDACFISDWNNSGGNTICSNRTTSIPVGCETPSGFQNTCWNTQGAALAFAFVPIGGTQGAFDYSSNNVTEFDTGGYSGNNKPANGKNYPTTVYPKPIPTTVDPFNPISNFGVVPYDSSMQFKIDDGNNDQNYYDNLGGYTVYIKKIACVAQNGAPVANGNFHKAGAVEARVASSAPAWNSPYDSGSALPIGSNTTATQDGTVYVRIYDGGEGSYLDPNSGNRSNRIAYVNNTGSMLVQVTSQQKSGTTQLTVPDSLFQDPSSVITGSIKQMFNGFSCTSGINCTNYPGMISLILELYIIFYAIMFMMGLVKVSQLDLVTRIFKIGLVLAFLRPDSWDFFNNYFFSAFLNGMRQVINMASANPIDGSPFAFAGPALQQLLLPLAPVYITAFILAGPAGIVVFFILLLAIYRFFIALFMSFSSYVMAVLAVAILIAVAPIFVPFILFGQTKTLFDNWLRLIVRYTLEPIFLLVGLAFVVGLFMIALNNVVSDQVCYKCAFVINVGMFNINIAQFCIHWFLPSGFDNYSPNIFVGLINKLDLILILLIFSDAIQNYSKFSVSMVAALTGSSGASIADNAGQMAMKAVTETAKTPFGMDERSKARRKQRNMQEEYSAEHAAKEKAGIGPDIAEKIDAAPGKAWDNTKSAAKNAPGNIAKGAKSLYNFGKRGLGRGSAGGSSAGSDFTEAQSMQGLGIGDMGSSSGGGDSGGLDDGGFGDFLNGFFED